MDDQQGFLLVSAAEGDQRFVMEGYTEDNRVVLISDFSKDWVLEDHYNMISDGFTVEGKGKPVFTIPKKLAPKLSLNTNYTISAVSRSDRRRVHFVPICQFYGVLNDSQGKPPADVHGGYCWRRGTGRARIRYPSA